MSTPVRCGVLGPLTLASDGGEPITVPGSRTRALLAHLLVEPGRPVPEDRLVDLLWGDRAPRDPRNALQTRVSALRASLDELAPGARALVVRDPAGYRLALDPGTVDAGQFRLLVAAARAAADPQRRRELLTEALGLWRGPAFADRNDEGRGAARLAAAAAALEEERAVAVEDLAEARLAVGEHAAVAAALAGDVDRYPLRERLRALRIRALAGAGRPAEALATFRELRERLVADLGTDPGPEVVAAHQAVLAPSPPPPAPSTLLPSSGVLVGRDGDVAAVHAHLADHRLVTLTGPGGVGKTRLALTAAHAERDRHPDGAHLVALAELPPGADRAALEGLLVRTLGLREAAAPLAATVRDRELLLVLDNGEHVVEALAALVADLLAAVPGLRVLVTSQEPLAIVGEVVVPVGPLAPEDAAALFAERARTSGADLPEDAADAVVALCERLDCLPLAVELAAARVRGLGLAGVAAGLDDRFGVLARGRRDAPARQRTLRATFDWAWALLATGERTALRRLASTAGGADLAGALAVTGAEPDVLARLVERSWLGLDESARFRLLESVAAYAAERSTDAGDADETRRRHATYYLALAEDADADLCGPDARTRLAALEADAANLRRAHATAVAAGDTGTAGRLVAALAWPWFLAGRHREALGLLRSTPGPPDDTRRTWHRIFALLVQDPLPEDPGPEPTDPRAAAVLAEVTVHFDEAGRGREALRRAESLAREDGDRWAAAAVASARAVEEMHAGDLARAERLAAAARDTFVALGERWGTVRATATLATLAGIRGDYDAADARHVTALTQARELGLRPEVVLALSGRGRIALLRGDPEAADAWHGEAWRLARERGDQAGQEHAAIGLGLAARHRGDLDGAEHHFTTWLAWNRSLDADHGVALLASQLGFVAELRGDATRARDYHREALAAADRAGAGRARALALEGLAGAAALDGDRAEARRLLDEAASLRGVPLPPAERGDVTRIEARIADLPRDLTHERALRLP